MMYTCIYTLLVLQDFCQDVKTIILIGSKCSYYFCAIVLDRDSGRVVGGNQYDARRSLV